MDQSLRDEALAVVSPGWLTERFQALAPRVRVDSVEVVHAADATNFNATLRIAHNSPVLSTTWFLKIPPVDPVRRARLDWASMGERETRFYRDLVDVVGFRVPRVFVADFEDTTGEFLLLMEHVDSDGCALPDPTVGIDPALVERALQDFAELHAHFERSSVRREQAPWLEPTGRTSDYGARLLREGIDGGAPVSPEFVAVAETYIAERDRLQDAWEAGPTTVLHGDAHIGNVFIDRSDQPNRLGLFDWGLMTVGSPMRDIGYFLTMTLDPVDRAEHERALIDAYLAARRRLGAAEISRNDAWRWHRVQSAYAVVASCQSILLPDTAGPRRRAFAEAFVARATRAVEDLDPLEALAEMD